MLDATDMSISAPPFESYYQILRSRATRRVIFGTMTRLYPSSLRAEIYQYDNGLTTPIVSINFHKTDLKINMTILRIWVQVFTLLESLTPIRSCIK